jgi:branched-chain amino acid transport system substrate-binding protein
MRSRIPVLGLGHGFDALAPLPVSSVDSSTPVVLRAAGWSADFAARNPTAVAVSSLYQRRSGLRMSVSAANAFTATIALAAAIDAAGSADPASVRAALRQLWVPATQTIMPWNGVRFGANGQNQLAAAVVEARAPGGYQVVFPRELATVPMVWAGQAGATS